MNLTISSNLSWVGQMRYIQALHEPEEFRGPDNLVRHFFPIIARLRCRFLSRDYLDALRHDPFYYYLLARTMYYDAVFVAAIHDNVQQIVNVGCGSDTRAHRFGRGLKEKGIQVLECDEPEAISVKERIARRLGPAEHINYAAIDLNDENWPSFEHWLDSIHNMKTVVIMEGVSPYINHANLDRFLVLLATKLSPDSLVAYDYKIQGVSDNLGRVGRTQNPFRLPLEKELAVAYHERLSFQVKHLEQSWELEKRLLPRVVDSVTPLFREDCLLQIRVNRG